MVKNPYLDSLNVSLAYLEANLQHFKETTWTRIPLAEVFSRGLLSREYQKTKMETLAYFKVLELSFPTVPNTWWSKFYPGSLLYLSVCLKFITKIRLEKLNLSAKFQANRPGQFGVMAQGLWVWTRCGLSVDFWCGLWVDLVWTFSPHHSPHCRDQIL